MEPANPEKKNRHKRIASRTQEMSGRPGVRPVNDVPSATQLAPRRRISESCRDSCIHSLSIQVYSTISCTVLCC